MDFNKAEGDERNIKLIFHKLFKLFLKIKRQ